MTELYSENPAMFKNHPFGFVISVLLIPAFGVGIIILLGWYLQTKSSRLVVTEHEILHEKGLLSKERREIGIDGVRTVTVKQSFTDRIFGVGTVEIYTAGDKPEISASGLPEPNTIRDLVKGRQKSSS